MTRAATGLASRRRRERASTVVELNGWDRTDSVLALVLFAACAAWSGVLNWLFGFAAVRLSIAGRWFQSDGWRVFDDMSSFSANHFRDSVHPLFSSLNVPLVAGLKNAFNLTAYQAIVGLNVLTAGVLAGLLYVILRLIGCTRITTVVFTLLAAVSSGSLFWMIVPETYPLGSVTIAACLAAAAYASRFRLSNAVMAAASAASLSITVTNWMAGLALAAVYRPWRQAALISLAGLLIVLGFWGVQKVIFPQPGQLFLKPTAVLNESEYILHKDAGGVAAKLRGILISPVVMPEIGQTMEQPTGRILSVQKSPLRDGLLANITILLWVLLLLAGIAALARGPADERFRRMLALVLAGQVCLHLIYGEETFLYALHFVPLLVVTAALSTTLFPRITPALGFCLVLLAALNNVHRLDEATRMPFSGTDERLIRLEAVPGR